MSMRWDPLLVAALARELRDRLGGARVRSIHLDGDARRVHLFGRDATLVFEMHPTRGWVSLLDPADPFETARPLASRIGDVRALPDESALVIELKRVRGREEGAALVIEWTARRWNALLVGAHSGTIRHVLTPRDEPGRTLRVGAEWSPPPSTGREGVDGDLSADRWQALLTVGAGEKGRSGDTAEGDDDAEAGVNADAADPRRALLRGVAWTSSLNVDRFLEPDGHAAWSAAIDPQNWRPLVIEHPRGLQPYPVELRPLASHPMDSLLDAIARARAADLDEPVEALRIPADLLGRARERAERARRKARGLRRERSGARDPETIRATGDLILARYGEIPEGVERVRLRGFDGESVEISLDPTLPPHENARVHYDEAARVERARASLPDRIESAEREADDWQRTAEALARGEADPDEVRRRLGPSRRTRRGRGDASPSLPYRTFRSSGGLEIRVGRGARANDDLTFHHSAPDDVWLHARQAPGAHVILRWGRDGNPPRTDLTEAATLAALNSEARGSGSVAVTWTRRKYVRKPRKAPPGSVVPERGDTIFVAPDPDLARRLQSS